MAYLALLIASSGSAYAAATVGSADIIDGSIRGIDIKTGSVKGADVGDGSITGQDVDESTLNGVDASTVASLSVKKINFQVPPGTANDYREPGGYVAHIDLLMEWDEGNFIEGTHCRLTGTAIAGLRPAAGSCIYWHAPDRGPA